MLENLRQNKNTKFFFLSEMGEFIDYKVRFLVRALLSTARELIDINAMPGRAKRNQPRVLRVCDP